MAMNLRLSDLEVAIRGRWPVITDYADVERRQMGGKGISLTGKLLRTHTVEQVIDKMVAVLPADAGIWALDGQLFRTPIGPRGYARDVVAVLFFSSEWPLVEEGGSFPEQVITAYGDVLQDVLQPDGELIKTQSHLIEGNNTVHQFLIDKRTHVLEIPPGLESEVAVWVIVRPRD